MSWHTVNQVIFCILPPRFISQDGRVLQASHFALKCEGSLFWWQSVLTSSCSHPAALLFWCCWRKLHPFPELLENSPKPKDISQAWYAFVLPVRVKNNREVTALVAGLCSLCEVAAVTRGSRSHFPWAASSPTPRHLRCHCS